jgi:formate/nitrite transporter FocA (FNT family)
MYFISAGLFAKGIPEYAAAYASARGGAAPDSLTWGAMLVRNLVPTTLGNIIGGSGLVGVAYWFVFLRGAKKGD